MVNSQAVISYISYFALAFWIWASQVAYNIRFQMPDWFHRLWTVLQLSVFCALAAFTSEFNVTAGLRADKDEAEMESLRTLDGFTADDISATSFRETILPNLNGKGISAVLAVSRFLLLIQYLLLRKNPFRCGRTR